MKMNNNFFVLVPFIVIFAQKMGKMYEELKSSVVF